MAPVSRSVGLLSGLVFTTGVFFALKRNVEKDINTHMERLKDVEYQLETAFLPEVKQAEQKDSRPLYREVHERPYILDLYDENQKHVKEVLVPQVKSDWNDRLINLAGSINSISFDFKNWKFSW